MCKLSAPQLFDVLYAAYGPQKWWPSESPFETIVGAILVQNTAWANVRGVMTTLREESLLEPRRLHALHIAELQELIRPVGYFRLKAKRLRNFLTWFIENYDGDLDAMFAGDQEQLRAELLTINGVGPETADSILLYAGEKSIFVVDAYTHRVMKRHAWIEPEADYHTLQAHFHDSLPCDASLFNEYHALFVRVGKEHCRATPRCDGCPLQNYLPLGGPAACE